MIPGPLLIEQGWWDAGQRFSIDTAMRLAAFAGGAGAGLEPRNTVGQVGGGGRCQNLMVLPGRLRWSAHLWGAQMSI